MVDNHPWGVGAHKPRVPNRIIFDKLVNKLVFGGSYRKHADNTVSATAIRERRDEWIQAGCFTVLEQAALDAYDTIIGLDLGDITVDGQITKAPCGGEAAGKSPVDCGKLGIKRSRMTDANGIPLGCVVTGANRNDSPLLRGPLVFLASELRLDADSEHRCASGGDPVGEFVGCHGWSGAGVCRRGERVRHRVRTSA